MFRNRSRSVRGKGFRPTSAGLRSLPRAVSRNRPRRGLLLAHGQGLQADVRGSSEPAPHRLKKPSSTWSPLGFPCALAASCGRCPGERTARKARSSSWVAAGGPLGLRRSLSLRSLSWFLSASWMEVWTEVPWLRFPRFAENSVFAEVAGLRNHPCSVTGVARLRWGCHKEW